MRDSTFWMDFAVEHSPILRLTNGEVCPVHHPEFISSVSLWVCKGDVKTHVDLIEENVTRTVAVILWSHGSCEFYQTSENLNIPLKEGVIFDFDPHKPHGLIRENKDEHLIYATYDMPEGMYESGLLYIVQQMLLDLLEV